MRNNSRRAIARQHRPRISLLCDNAKGYWTCSSEADHVSHIFKLVRDIAPLVDGVKKTVFFIAWSQTVGESFPV